MPDPGPDPGPDPSAPRPCLYDVNALVALALTTHVHHRAAHAHLAGLRGQGSWWMTPITEAGLYRLLLNPRVTGSLQSFAQVDRVVRSLKGEPRCGFLPDDSSLAVPTINAAVLGGHQQVTDLHLANLAARHGAVLATFDADLATWLDPADRRYVELIAAD